MSQDNNLLHNVQLCKTCRSLRGGDIYLSVQRLLSWLVLMCEDSEMCYIVAAIVCVTLKYIVLHCIIFKCFVLHCVTLKYIVLHCVALCCIVLYFITFSYIVLYFVILLQCNTLCYILLHCVTSRRRYMLLPRLGATLVALVGGIP